jgi:hypothetical protein
MAGAAQVEGTLVGGEELWDQFKSEGRKVSEETELPTKRRSLSEYFQFGGRVLTKPVRYPPPHPVSCCVVLAAYRRV